MSFFSRRDLPPFLPSKGKVASNFKLFVFLSWRITAATVARLQQVVYFHRNCWPCCWPQSAYSKDTCLYDRSITLHFVVRSSFCSFVIELSDFLLTSSCSICLMSLTCYHSLYWWIYGICGLQVL
jgi:hypothetical protein